MEKGDTTPVSCKVALSGSDFSSVTVPVISNLVEYHKSLSCGETKENHSVDSSPADNSKDPITKSATKGGKSHIILFVDIMLFLVLILTI